MPNENKSSTEGLPQPIKFMAEFIDKYFMKMSPPVRVIVFLGFFFLVLLAGLKFLFPDLFNVLSRNPYIEVHGTLSSKDGDAISGNRIMTDLMGEGLYVYKEPTPPRSSNFKYSWILRVPKESVDRKTRFALMEGADEKARVDIKPSELMNSEKDGEAQLEVDKDFTEIRLVTLSPNQGVNEGSLASIVGLPTVHIHPQEKGTRISSDSAKTLVKNYKAIRNPVAQMQIREVLADAGVPTMVSLAESLKTAVYKHKRDDIADYARLLSGNDSLGLLTSAGAYSSIFEGQFYPQAAEVMHAGDDNASRNMASFLRDLQDARSLPYVFREYSHSPNVVAKKLCLIVLKGFVTNSSQELRNEIVSWLAKTKKDNSIEDLNGPLSEAMTTFTRQSNK